MGRPRKDATEMDTAFVSIEEDASLIGMEVDHAGMSQHEAQELENDLNALGLVINVGITVKDGTGYTRSYTQEVDKRESHFKRYRYYNLPDARYHVYIQDSSGHQLVLENRRQAELFTKMALGKTLTRTEIKSVNIGDLLKNYELTPERAARLAKGTGLSVEQVEHYLRNIA